MNPVFITFVGIFIYFLIGLSYHELNNKAVGREVPPFVVVIWLPLMVFYGSLKAVYGFGIFFNYVFGVQK